MNADEVALVDFDVVEQACKVGAIRWRTGVGLTEEFEGEGFAGEALPEGRFVELEVELQAGVVAGERCPGRVVIAPFSAEAREVEQFGVSELRDAGRRPIERVAWGDDQLIDADDDLRRFSIDLVEHFCGTGRPGQNR